VNDRRFAGRGFKRQTPIGPHICDFVSFPLRTVIDLKPAEEEKAAAATRADKRAWLAERGYGVVEIAVRDIEADIDGTLDRLAATLDAAEASAKS
jgi:tRNA/rRNA methyltransferase